MISPVITKGAPIALKGVYSQAIIANNMVFCSGQIPADVSGNVIEGDIQAHTKQCISNLKAVLEAAGSSIDKVVKVNVFLSDMGNFSAMNEIYSKMFAEPKPARTCVAVRTLPKDVDIEIEATAVLD